MISSDKIQREAGNAAVNGDHWDLVAYLPDQIDIGVAAFMPHDDTGKAVFQGIAQPFSLFFSGFLVRIGVGVEHQRVIPLAGQRFVDAVKGVGEKTAGEAATKQHPDQMRISRGTEASGGGFTNRGKDTIPGDVAQECRRRQNILTSTIRHKNTILPVVENSRDD